MEDDWSRACSWLAAQDIPPQLQAGLKSASEAPSPEIRELWRQGIEALANPDSVLALASCRNGTHLMQLIDQICHNRAAVDVDTADSLAASLSILLSLFPQLRQLGTRVLLRSRPLLEPLTRGGDADPAVTERILASGYRVLSWSPAVFSSAWDWTPAVTALTEASSTAAARSWAARTLAIVLNSSDATRAALLRAVGGQLSLVHTEAVEAAALCYCGSFTGTSSRPATAGLGTVSGHAIVEVQGTLLTRPSGSEDVKADDCEWVDVPSAQHNISAAAAAISLGWGVLLEGAPGSGKTATINELARRTGAAETMVSDG